MPAINRNSFRFGSGSSASKCPICKQERDAIMYRRDIDPNQIFGFCPCCSEFWIGEDAIEYARSINKIHLLSAYFRKLSPGYPKKLITTEMIDTVIEESPNYSILDQFDLMLSLINEMCPSPGTESKFNPSEDWPLIFLPNSTAGAFIYVQLMKAGLITDNGWKAKLTWDGYKRLREIQTSGRNSQQAFVAMSFSKEQEYVWNDIIKPAIEQSGFKAMRVDKEEHSDKIDDKIIAEIRKSRFLVADFTKQRNGVYFEAGFAHGLGRTVIWLCHESDKQNLHFDTRQYNHIFYDDDVVKAREDLKNRIEAMEGHGDYKPEA